MGMIIGRSPMPLNSRGHCGPSADVRRSAAVTTTHAGRCRMSVETAPILARDRSPSAASPNRSCTDQTSRMKASPEGEGIHPSHNLTSINRSRAACASLGLGEPLMDVQRLSESGRRRVVRPPLEIAVGGIIVSMRTVRPPTCRESGETPPCPPGGSRAIRRRAEEEKSLSRGAVRH